MKLKNMWSKRIGHELYIFHNGQPIYKRWLTKNNKKTQPSLIFGKKGWPNEQVHTQEKV